MHVMQSPRIGCEARHLDEALPVDFTVGVFGLGGSYLGLHFVYDALRDSLAKEGMIEPLVALSGRVATLVNSD